MSTYSNAYPAFEGGLFRWISQLCDDELSPDDAIQFAALLRNDPSARQLYLELMETDALLWRSDWSKRNAADAESPAAELALPSQSSRPAVERVAPNRFAWKRRHAISLAAAMVIMLLLLATMAFWRMPRHYGMESVLNNAPSSGFSEKVSPVAAYLTDAFDCRWRHGRRLVRGMKFSAGEELVLERGVAEVTFVGGAVVLLEGPTRFQLDSSNEGSLNLGRLSARVPERAVGFTVRTPLTDIVDLGTEFDAVVHGNDKTEIQVYAGKVELVPRAQPVEEPSPARRVLAGGEGVKITADVNGKSAVVQAIPFSGKRFVRMPEQIETQPIAVAGVRASSVCSMFPELRGPENLIHGRGLDGERHSSVANQTMWHTEIGDIAGEFVIFDLGEVRRLHALKIWNFNESTEHADFAYFLLLRGVKEASIYTSLTGEGDPQSEPEAWSPARRNVRLKPGEASDDYASPSVVSMNGASGRYVAIVIHSDFFSDHAHDPAYRRAAELYFPRVVGLSEVQFFGLGQTAEEAK